MLEQTTDAELISPWLPKPSSLDAWKEMLTVRWILFHELLDGLQTRECKCAVWTDGSAAHQDATFSMDSAYAVVSADTATGTQRNLFHAGIGDEQLEHACNQAFKVDWTAKVLRLLAQGVNKHAARDFSLVKTKAHVSVGKIQSDNQRYVSAGNWFADLAAKAAMRGDGKGAQDLHASVVTQEKNILNRFRILWHGLVLSTRQYIRARTQHDTQECIRPENSVEPGLVAERDIFWRQEAPASWPLGFDASWRSNLRMCVWGATWSAALMEWIQRLRWPDTKASGPGVSWLELALSFIFFSGLEVPIPDPSCKGLFISPTLDPRCSADNRPLGKVVKAFQDALRTTTHVFGVVFPWDAKSKIFLRTLFPCDNYVCGLEIS